MKEPSARKRRTITPRASPACENAVFAAIADLIGRERWEDRLSLKRIAARAGYSVAAVKMAIKQLIAQGRIHRREGVRRGPVMLADVFSLARPAEPSAEPVARHGVPPDA